MSSTSAEELRTIALHEFAEAGYAATSIQRLADLAGVSKASVLYHFASKEALLAAAVGPALDRFDRVVEHLGDFSNGPGARDAFTAEFVDFILDHRLEVHLFINQGPALHDVPIVARANDIVARLTEQLTRTMSSSEQLVRFGVALGGSAYFLVSAHRAAAEAEPIPELREVLIRVITDLLTPISDPE